MIIDGIDITSLLKAFKKFESFRIDVVTERDKAGVIQAFEYCFDLAWKMMQRLLAKRGKIANSPRTTFRDAALEEFIDDPELWFIFLEKRNLTVHTYEEDEVENVISICPIFASEIKKFLSKIGVPENEY